jgi:hypothetical protein
MASYRHCAVALLLCAAASSAAGSRLLLQATASDAYSGYKCFYNAAKSTCVSNVFYAMTLSSSTTPTDM